MKMLISSAVMLIALIFNLQAQELELPRVSPKASVGYTIGLTDIKVNYGAPAVKGRVIWGGLVPYGEIWRAGANEATTVEFSSDVNMEGQALRAGKYALFFIPGEKDWTVIFNKKWDQWGAYKYDETEDAIRFTVEPKMNESLQERLSYSIHDMKMDMGYIKLSFEKMRLYLRFKVDVMTPALVNIESAIDSVAPDRKWIIYTQAAEFMLNAENGDMDRALEWSKLSTAQQGTSWNWYVRGQVESKMGDHVAAVESGTKAIQLGMAFDNDPFYKEHSEEISAAIQGWAAKLE